MAAAEKVSTELGTAAACRAFGFPGRRCTGVGSGGPHPVPSGPAYGHLGH